MLFDNSGTPTFSTVFSVATRLHALIAIHARANPIKITAVKTISPNAFIGHLKRTDHVSPPDLISALLNAKFPIHEPM